MLQPHLHRVDLPARQVLIRSGAPLERTYFVESGLVSLIMQIGGTRLEVGMIGPEGFVGGSTVILGSRSSPYEHVVQICGSALAIELPDLQDAMERSASLRRRMLRFVQSELFQARQTAFVNASFGIETRLARWLLMCHDRVEGDDLLLTHEVLAVMLGVQRSGVTLAVQNLEGSGYIRARRGRITITDRARLQEAAGGSYGVAEAAYRHLVEED
ncbi:Crp/Fnr family transcriptional regulator [Methylobacterium sp. M6A4_1b]